ncbi:MAG: hypothetical protein SPD90_06110, partial [Intestinibacter sp.]|uniref:hypothetical protein n=1 Tax=Intestinibacter sp. TaxID=1965304 RepID=UPI002A86F019|nr:hypothetical protein [Intestinibacter sp.]
MSNEGDRGKETSDREKLEKYVKDYRIFIDTCSLLHPESNKFWNNIIPILHMYNSKIIIPKRSIDELEKHSNNKQNSDLSSSANNCKIILSKLIRAGYVEIRGEETDNFADNVFQVVFTKFRMTHNLLLITQDNNLAKDILALNDSKSVKGKSVVVKKINKQGYLSSFSWKENKKRVRGKNLAPHKVFKVCTEVTSIPDTKLNISRIPSENEIVYTSQGEIKLTKELGAGGEAIVYETSTPYVAKIYKKDNLTARKYEKIKLMLTKKINCQGVCYPVEIVYNSNKEFVGYLMPKAEGIELQKSVFGPKPLFLRKFPGWKKRDTVQLCITILKKIKYLHDRNIIIGDINPANILVVSPEQVYFVDTDSFQVEDFPCPV